MRTFIYFQYLALSMIFVSCNSNFESESKELDAPQSIEKSIEQVPIGKLETVVYDGCEYLIFKEERDANSAFGYMSHKGNCSNPIHLEN